MLSIPPSVFVPAVIVSAITWNVGYLAAGRLLGPYWEQASEKLGGVERMVLLGALIVVATLIGRAIIRRGREPA